MSTDRPFGDVSFLTVAEASACRLRGTVVDEQGQPIAGAKVEVADANQNAILCADLGFYAHLIN